MRPRAGVLFLAAVLVLAAVWWAFPPRWETNDDVAMAMVAHGFGGADHPSGELVFSSVAWGTFVSALGMPFGIPGYTIGTFLSLGASAAALAWAARALSLGRLGTAAVLVLLLLRATLFPQFTIGAGLLAVAGCALLAVAPQRGQPGAWVAAALLLLASFTIRREECLLVVAAFTPALPWRSMARHAAARRAGAALLLAVLAVSAWDAATYRDPAWARFNDLNPARAAFTDFGRASLLKGRPEILARWGLTANDVDLVAGWFFADRVLADPQRLRGALAELGQVGDTRPHWQNAWEGVHRLRHPELEWLLLGAACVGLLFPGWRLAACWAVAVAALAAMGYAGRPGILRVYVPLLAALVVAPLALRQARGHPGLFARLRLGAAGAVLAVIAACQATDLHRAWEEGLPAARKVAEEMRSFPRATVVVWGSQFPFEDTYPPVPAEDPRLGPRIHGLGTFTYAPFSVAVADEARGRDFVSLLNGTEGVLLLADDANVARLAIYCVEHFDGRLQADHVQAFSFGRLRRVWCRT